jgi:hypothetical protein
VRVERRVAATVTTRFAPRGKAFDAGRDTLGFARHDPMAGVDFDAVIRAEPAFQSKRERAGPI